MHLVVQYLGSYFCIENISVRRKLAYENAIILDRTEGKKMLLSFMVIVQHIFFTKCAYVHILRKKGGGMVWLGKCTNICFLSGLNSMSQNFLLCEAEYGRKHKLCTTWLLVGQLLSLMFYIVYVDSWLAKKLLSLIMT